MRFLSLALVSMFFLTGCAVPPAVTIASFVADGVSYAATGKSTTDHAISAIARQDCALLRAVQEEAICDPDGEVLVEFVGASRAQDSWTDHGDFHLQEYGAATFRGPDRPVETVRVPR